MENKRVAKLVNALIKQVYQQGFADGASEIRKLVLRNGPRRHYRRRKKVAK